MRRRSGRPIQLLTVLASTVVALGVATTPIGAEVTPDGAGGSPVATNEESEAVQAFVDRINSRFDTSIDPADYEVRESGGERWIVRKDTATPRTTTVRREGQAEGESDTFEKVFSPGTTRPPTPDEAARMRASGDVTIMQETEWFQPTCFGRLTDPDDAGNMDTCYKWGDQNYAGETRANWAFHMYGSCWPGGANFFEVVDCFVDTVRAPSSGTLYWNSWSPAGTIDLSSCGSFTLSANVGPVGGSWTHNTCGQVIPQKDPAPGDMRTRVEDDIYSTSSVREIGQMIGIGVPFNQSPVLSLNYGYHYQSCTPGNPIDWCG